MLFVDIAIESISFPSLAQVLSEITHFVQVSQVYTILLMLENIFIITSVLTVIECLRAHCKAKRYSNNFTVS